MKGSLLTDPREKNLSMGFAWEGRWHLFRHLPAVYAGESAEYRGRHLHETNDSRVKNRNADGIGSRTVEKGGLQTICPVLGEALHDLHHVPWLERFVIRHQRRFRVRPTLAPAHYIGSYVFPACTVTVSTRTHALCFNRHSLQDRA